MIELPHTTGCLVCGRENPHGLHLSLFVDPATGIVRTEFTPTPDHVGFDGIIHGGAIATVVDEAMVWSATWFIRRFCVCGEMTVRFRHPAAVGQKLSVEARVEFSRPKLIETTAKVFDASNKLMATASGKYLPMEKERHQKFVATLIADDQTAVALQHLK